MRSFLSYLIVFGVFLVFSSCEKVVYEAPVIPEVVSFQTDVAPALQKDCIQCHDVFKKSSNYYKKLATSTFIDTVNAISSKTYVKLNTNDTHKGYTSSATKILKWFEQGAKNN